MTIKRVILALLVVAMAIAPVAHAQDVPTCADEHLTGADCQGADTDPSPNGCEIEVWVGKASCDLIAPDGAASIINMGAWAWADQPSAAEVDIVVRDKATGTVLFQEHQTGQPAGIDPSKVTAAVDRFVDDVSHGRTGSLQYDILTDIPSSVGGQFVSNTNGTFTAWLSPQGGAEVTCEVTGTHSQLGAATAAAGDTPNLAITRLPQRYSNTFGCVVDRQEGPGPAISPGAHGCVARYPDPYPTGYLGSSCTFTGNGAFAPNGVISATSGSWAVTHEVGGVTVTDVSGTGPNVFPFPFAEGVRYTLTVAADGVGAVAAGSPQ